MQEELFPLFTRAKSSFDAAYLECEAQLLAAGAGGTAFLSARAVDDADPVARFMARVLAAGGAGGRGSERPPSAEWAHAERRLDAMEERAHASPRSSPRSDVAAEVLTNAWAGRLTGILALHLVKQPGWPAWRIKTALTYLDAHVDPATLPALVRYAVREDDSLLLGFTVALIKKMESPDIVERMLEEARFLARAAAPPQVR